MSSAGSAPRPGQTAPPWRCGPPARSGRAQDNHGHQILTPQELEIARLAAAGLSNKQIGDRLFMSHRTVASHLYRIFPKLGITSRAALGRALPRDAGLTEVERLESRGHSPVPRVVCARR